MTDHDILKIMGWAHRDGFPVTRLHDGDATWTDVYVLSRYALDCP